MKWIRTECGDIITVGLEHTCDYICVDESTIKKQGDSKWRVLNKFDILIHKVTNKPEIYRGVTCDYKQIVCNQLDRFIDIDKLDDYYILTKEQYMPLAQEG